MENLLTKLSPELQAKVYEACPPSTQATMDNHARTYGVRSAATGAIVFGTVGGAAGMAGVALCAATAPACLIAGMVGGGVLGGTGGYVTGQLLGNGKAKQGNMESDEACVADTVARLTKRPAPAATR
jgi:hypothetical protein